MRKNIKNPLFLFYILVLYVVVQFSWWLYLIASLYSKTYSDESILEKKTLMLVGEGTVFVLILFGGVFMIRRAYQKEQRLNQLQENFLLSISHELKTPISSIQLFLQTLRKRELDESRRDEIYSQSLTEIKRLESLVNNLLLTRSIENRNYFIDKKRVDVESLISEIILVAKESYLKNFICESSLTKTEIEVDRDALVSIISNLLQNAAKYSPSNSKISIESKIAKSNFIVVISDEGIGIPDDKKEAVFERFFRDENEMTRKSKGTGLGLFITKYLVNLHGGKILIEDNQPKGTKVSVIIPVG